MACDGGSFGCLPRLVVEKALEADNSVRPMQHAGKEVLPFLPLLSNVTACDRDHHESCAPCYDNGGLNTGWLLLVIPGLIWGASFLFIAEGLRSLGPNGVCFMRICVGFATLALFPSSRKPVERGDWGSVVWLGLLWLHLPSRCFHSLNSACRRR